MFTIYILASLLILLVITKVVYNKVYNTITKNEVKEQVQETPVMHTGVIYIYPKYTLNEMRNKRNNSDSSEEDIDGNELGKYDRVQQILQANPPREKRSLPKLTIREWMQNDFQYQSIRKQLRHTG